jgi:glycerol-3-phosphate dehydrogenase
MNAEFHLDVLILGGGIAGLWTARRLHAAGHVCALVERDALGSDQTSAAQGMIHGGLKYALDGHPSAASEALAAMPGRWRACLDGIGELDLSGVTRLADACWLWADDAFRGRLVTLLASRLLRGRAAASRTG